MSKKRSGDGAQRDAGLMTPRTPMRTPLTRAQTSKDHCEFRLCVRQGALRCGYLLSCGTSNDTHTHGRFTFNFPFNKITNVQKNVVARCTPPHKMQESNSLVLRYCVVTVITV